MRKSFVIVFCLLMGGIVFGQVENKSDLTIEQIMQGEEFVGYLPSNIRWSPDNQTIYYSWNPDGKKLRDTYKVTLKNTMPAVVSNEELMEKVENGVYSQDRNLMAYSKDGDIYLWNKATSSKLQITNTNDYEYRPYFFDNDSKVVFHSGDNLYAWSIEFGTLVQLTDFRSGRERKDRPKSEQAEWLERDQLEYFEIVRQRKEIRDLRKENSKALKPKRPLPIYYGSNRINNIRLSPDMNYVTYSVIESPKSKNTSVPDFVTESGYLDDLRSRPKVGSPQNKYELWIYNIAEDTTYQVSVEQLEGILDKPAFLEDYHKGEEAYKAEYKKLRSVIYHGPVFSEDGKAAIEIKSLDNKDRWIMLMDLTSGALTQLDRQHDDAWIGGPGIYGWNSVGGNMDWISNDQLYYQSEESGYSHLYCVNVNTKKKKALTKGKFEILEAELSLDKSKFYITSNKENPHEHHFYSMPVEGGKMTKITSEVGNHQVTMSPNEEMLAIRYSYSNKPWELYLMENKPGAEMIQVTNSTTDAFKQYEWREPEIVYFKAEDGTEVPARLYKPNGEVKNDAAVVFVHGAGYLQNVHNWWSSYYREYMFHNILADNGYTVLDIDYRASEGYGRDWRTSIYRFMGGKDLDDQVDGAKYLVDNHGIDAERIGIYGGSYGGFITLMAMFTKPGTFKSGAALRSVTDWAHYNHAYTSNILNTPVEDSIAYYKSSPIYHAEGLQDNLLILHGMIDTNVQFQDVVRLAQRLIELGKDDWEFAVFPVEGHGFRESSSWADEYKRIFKLFQDTLQE